MLEIISHTPRWVFALFIGLLVLGIQQSKTRAVSLRRLALLPIAMLALSFSGVWNTFNGSALGTTCWVLAMAATALLAQRIDFAKGVRYLADTRQFILPGSWLPLVLTMAIFLTKYGVGISLARQSELSGVPLFVAGISVAYGFFSGAFFGRMAKILSMHARQAFAKTPA